MLVISNFYSMSGFLGLRTAELWQSRPPMATAPLWPLNLVSWVPPTSLSPFLPRPWPQPLPHLAPVLPPVRPRLFLLPLWNLQCTSQPIRVGCPSRQKGWAKGARRRQGCPVRPLGMSPQHPSQPWVMEQRWTGQRNQGGLLPLWYRHQGEWRKVI